MIHVYKWVSSHDTIDDAMNWAMDEAADSLTSCVVTDGPNVVEHGMLDFTCAKCHKQLIDMPADGMVIDGINDDDNNAYHSTCLTPNELEQSMS